MDGFEAGLQRTVLLPAFRQGKAAARFTSGGYISIFQRRILQSLGRGTSRFSKFFVAGNRKHFDDAFVAA
jgi:hypothetical protein